MARKAMMIDETLEFDPAVRTEADEARAEIAEAQRAARRKKDKNAPVTTSDRPTAAILPIYLREMGATPLIDETKEVELARELQEAREALAKIALRLPASAKEYVLEDDFEGPKRGREWPLDDMLAFYGKLARFAREHRDGKAGAAFKTAREHKKHVDHARDALILANLRLVVHIAKKLRMPVVKVEEILGVVQEPQALEDLSADDDAPGLLRFVADPNAVSPLERTVDRELREKIESTLRVLNTREEEIIRLRFGIGRDMPYTLEEIGRVMGLSRERVRQIEATALKKIQSAQECRDLREFLA